MSNIDKQALRGQSVEGSFYLVECCNCGEMYPSNLLDGGEAIADSGDYGDCYCHLCGADDTERADWGDVNSNEAKAWNFQQKRIELEAAEKRIAELETREVKLPNPHAHLIWIQAGHAPDDYWDDVAVSHSEKDKCCDGSDRYPVYALWEIKEALSAIGINIAASGKGEAS